KTYNAVMRKSINRFSTVQIACSTWAGKFLYGEKKMHQPSYHLVFNSVDTDLFLAHYDDAVGGEFCDEWHNVLNVARITAVKNQEFLIEIAEKFKQSGKKIRILCAGNGDEEYVNKAEKQIEQKQLGSYIKLLGVRKDIDVLMRKSDAFVLPSKYEGMPLVMIEAQASGLPCVSADTYSPEVDFGIGSVTWLSLDKGAAVWAEALEKAVEKKRADKDKVEKVIKEKRFDSKMFAETVCDLYLQDYALRGRKND
ncbi:MAG: glycosyltransferase, partial [Eubacterium sp.]